MTRAPFKTDRLATIIVALLLLVLGLALIDWRYRLVFSGYPKRISLGSLPSWTASGWWPWAFALVALTLGLIGLWWLFAHTRSTSSKAVKMPQSSEHGTVTLDTSSLSGAVAKSFQDLGPFTSVTATTTELNGARTLLLTAQLDEFADGTSIDEAVRTLHSQLRSAFPDQGVTARVLLTEPRTRRSARPDRSSIRVS